MNLKNNIVITLSQEDNETPVMKLNHDIILFDTTVNYSFTTNKSATSISNSDYYVIGKRAEILQ